MDREECRFCQIVPNPVCPKVNALSAQLIQYHYGEEFFFYFAKPVNDILRGCKTPETILYHDICSELRGPAFKLKIFSQAQATSMLRTRAAISKTARTEPVMANHSCWKILRENRGNDRAFKSTEVGQSRRRRPAGRFPLRQGSLYGKLLPTEAVDGQKVAIDHQFADVGGSFCTKVFDIYDPSYSSEEPDRKSVQLEARVELNIKPRVPLLDIKRLVKAKSAGQILKTSAELNFAGLSKGNLQGSTQNYSTQFSLEASRSRLIVPHLKSEEAAYHHSTKRSKTHSRSKKKISRVIDDRPLKKAHKKEESRIKLNINLKAGSLIDRIKSPKTSHTWAEFFYPKKSVGHIAKSYRNKQTENKPSIIGTEMLSSRTAKEKPKKTPLQGRDSSARKSMVVNFSSPKVNAMSTRLFKHSFKLDPQTRPTLQIVKQQLSKLSAKGQTSKTKSPNTLATMRSNSKKKFDLSRVAFGSSPILKMEKNVPLIMSHRLMPSMRLLKSSEDYRLELERSPKTQRQQDLRKTSLTRNASKSTSRKVYPSSKKKSASKDKAEQPELFGRKFRKTAKKKPLLNAVHN